MANLQRTSWFKRAFAFTYDKITGRSFTRDLQTLGSIKKQEAHILQLEQKIRILSALQTIPHIQEKVSGIAVPPSNEWLHEEVFILGSGASLNQLSSEERGFLSRQPTIALNKYLLYWDIIGVWPTYTYLADVHPPTPEVLTRKIEIIAENQDKKLPVFLLTSDYRNWPMSPLKPLFFKRYHSMQSENHVWAESIDDTMYFHRGSLTCLLNLITVLRLAPKVCLLGVDLDQGDAFYRERYQQDISLHDHWEKIRQDTGIHPTAISYKNTSPIQEKLPWIFQQMSDRGISVSCYNKNSLLVKNGLCPVREPLT
jgi:hypothetical protein